MKNNLLLAFITLGLLACAFFALTGGDTALLALKKPFELPKTNEHVPPAPWPEIDNMALKVFADKFYDSFRRNDIEERRSLVGKKSLACIDRISKVVFQEELAQSNADFKTQDFEVRENGEKSIMAMPDVGFMPETPDTTADIAWVEMEGEKKHHNFYRIALKKDEKGEYYQVAPCITEVQAREKDEIFNKKILKKSKSE